MDPIIPREMGMVPASEGAHDIWGAAALGSRKPPRCPERF